MDPFSRKLFKKSDARERLSQMGGIVASSPELASTVQRFQVGGDVTGLPPELLNNPSVQRLAARQGLSPAEYLMALSPEALSATMAQIEQQAARPAPMTAGQNLMEMVPSFDPAPMDDFAMEFGDAGAGFPMPPATPAEEVLPFSSTADRQMALQERASSLMPQRQTTPFDPSPDTVRPMPRPEPEPELEETFEESEARAIAEQEAAAQAAAADADAPERTVDPMAGAADETANELRQVFGLPSPDRAPKNRRERVEQELDLIKDVFGHRNKDEARERAMNLAMIGLAIAAGQSPNALTNIAQGALAGTQAMQRAQAAEREREDALRMQAYESVLGEEREDRQFERQKELAEFRAGLAGPAGSGTTTPTDPGNLFATELNRVLGAGLDTPIGLRIAEIEDPAEKEAFALQTALDNVLTVSPAASEADVARMREVEQRVRERIGRLRGADAGSLSPAQSVTLDAARQSLERNPANRAAIESRLRSVGIDPSLL